MRPPSPSTFSRTSKPKTRQSQSIAAAASAYTSALEKRGQSGGVGLSCAMAGLFVNESVNYSRSR